MTAKTFPKALAALLRSRKLRVPSGLEQAPPEAYANQPPELVARLEDLDDESLMRQAAHIAGFERKREARLKAVWDDSPLIKEIKRRKLKPPPRPRRVVGAAISFKRPLREWTDEELLAAAREWSKRGG